MCSSLGTQREEGETQKEIRNQERGSEWRGAFRRDMGFGAGRAGERTKEESSRAGGRSWWGRGLRKAEEQMSSEVGLRGGGDLGRGCWGSENRPSPSPSVFLGNKWSESLSPSPPQPSHLCPATSPCLLALLELELEPSCSIGVTGAEAPPLSCRLLVTRTRLFIKWAQRAWAMRQLGVAGGGGAHCPPL